MNFKPFDKFLLVLLMLVIILIAGVLIGSALSLISVEALMNVVGLLGGGVLASIIGGLIGLVLLILAFRMFIAMGQPPAPQKPTSTLLMSGEIGSAYVALSAIDSMVQRHVRDNPKVKDCESRIAAVEEGVNISLRICVHFETMVPAFVEEMQSSLKTYVESTSGIKVKDIEILIISAPLPPKTSVK